MVIKDTNNKITTITTITITIKITITEAKITTNKVDITTTEDGAAGAGTTRIMVKKGTSRGQISGFFMEGWVVCFFGRGGGICLKYALDAYGIRMLFLFVYMHDF